jgi:hypothetical protein
MRKSPAHRAVQSVRAITSRPVLGGLDHQYCRIYFSAHTGRGIVRRLEARNMELLRSLQGEKESVAYTALQFLRGGLPKNDSQYKNQVIESLVLGAVFQGSDRARAMIFSVLMDGVEKNKEAIEAAINLVEAKFEQFDDFQLSQMELDLSKARVRLGALKKVLHL